VSGTCPNASFVAGPNTTEATMPWARLHDRAGVTPDLLGEVGWWDTNDLWVWSLYVYCCGR
jgi:hypothetical protein